MAFIEPGQLFEIEFGNGHKLEVAALAGRKQGQLQKMLGKIAMCEANGNAESLLEMVEEALAICVGAEKAAEMFDTSVDCELAMQICQKTMLKQVLSEDERKKSESPHSS